MATHLFTSRGVQNLPDSCWTVGALLTSKSPGEADPTLEKFSSFCRSEVTTCFLTLHLRRRNDAGSASSSVALPFVVFSATRPLSCRKRRTLLAAAAARGKRPRAAARDPPCCTRCRRRRPIVLRFEILSAPPPPPRVRIGAQPRRRSPHLQLPNLGTALFDVTSTSIDEVFLSENSTVPPPPANFLPPP